MVCGPVSEVKIKTAKGNPKKGAGKKLPGKKKTAETGTEPAPSARPANSKESQRNLKKKSKLWGGRHRDRRKNGRRPT